MGMKRAGKIDSGTASPKAVATQKKVIKTRTKAILGLKPKAVIKGTDASLASAEALVSASRKNMALNKKRSGPKASPVAKKK
jgi:hypothetical protein